MKACQRWLPRLAAEESLVAVTQVATASGTLEADVSKRVVRGWQQEAGQEPPRPPRATPEGLQAIGIGSVKA